MFPHWCDCGVCTSEKGDGSEGVNILFGPQRSKKKTAKCSCPFSLTRVDFSIVVMLNVFQNLYIEIKLRLPHSSQI